MVFVESDKLRAYVLLCQRVLHAYVPTCLQCLRAHVQTYLACLFVPTFVHAHLMQLQMTISFQWYVFDMLVLCLLFLSSKTVIHYCIAHTRQKPLAYVMTDFAKIKWFDFYLSITLRVVFKWLVKGERWILMCGS